MPADQVFKQALTIPLAAAPENSSYADDHSWAVALAAADDEPALTLMTRFGGRVGLARLVPVITLNGQAYYEKSDFHAPFTLKSLLPQACTLKAEVIDGLSAQLFIWVIDSQTLGGRVALDNQTGKPFSAEIGLFMQGMQGKEGLTISLVEFVQRQRGHIALEMGGVKGLTPILMLGSASPTKVAKLSSSFDLPPKGEVSRSFVQAARPSRDDALTSAHEWLYKTDWQPYLQSLNERIHSLLSADTGDDALDAALTWSQQAVLRSMIGPTRQLAQPSPVFTRGLGFGYSPKGDGSDHNRWWGALLGLDTWLLGSSLAVLNPQLTMGIIRNYLAKADAQGRIDGGLGAGGQRGGYRLLPILAQLTEIIYQHSGDKAFVAGVWPNLLKFYLSWFDGEGDQDADGFPEWASAKEANLVYHPLFANPLNTNPQADISLVECPDLAAYLLREGEALRALAAIVKQSTKPIAPTYKRLAESLQLSWDAAAESFRYRDRDSHLSPDGAELFRTKGDNGLPNPLTFETPARLLIKIHSGNQALKILSITLRGLNAEGKPASEEFQADDFTWGVSGGSASSQNIWRQIKSITVNGLSRVYEYSLHSLDLNRQDLSALLPYITEALKPKQYQALYKTLQGDYLQAYGLSNLPAYDPQYAKIGQAQQMNPVWLAMFGLAMLKRGQSRASADLFTKFASAQTAALQNQGAFFQWYHAETGAGLGLADHVSGAISLHWFMALCGLSILDSQTVVLHGAFVLRRRVILQQYRVRVARSNASLKIQFPSGGRVELPVDAPPQIIRDPKTP